MRSANLLMSITIVLYLLVATYFCLVKLKMKKIENAKNVNDLDKGTLRYFKRYNFSKEIILSEISKKINHLEKGIASMKKFMLIAFIFIFLHFMLEIISALMKVKTAGKMFLDSKIDCILITLVFLSFCVMMFIKFTQKYITFLRDQLTRLL